MVSRTYKRPPPPKSRIEELRRVGKQALGEKWVYRLSKIMGVAIRSAQRWNNGTHPIPDETFDFLYDQAEKRNRARLDMRIADLLEEVQKVEGLDPIIIAGALRDAADSLTPSEEDVAAVEKLTQG
jgi:hypothetical protein